MRSITIYTYDELSDKAKAKACDIYRSRCYEYGLPYEQENQNSIEHIAKLLKSYIKYDEYNNIGFNYLHPYDVPNDALDLKGIRALKYIFNNYIDPNMEGKFYCHKNISYHSKCTEEFSCPFTGYYIDDALYVAYERFIYDLRSNSSLTVEKFIVDYVSSVIKEWLEKDYNYLTSDECISDILINNEYEFFENGKVYSA